MSGTRGSAASSSQPAGAEEAWWPPTQSNMRALALHVRTAVNRVVFQIDAEQEARMRAYLDQTYGDGKPQGERPIMMDALRPPKPVERVVPPPTSLDEEVARRLYEQLNAQQGSGGAGGSRASSGKAARSGDDPRPAR